MRSSGPGVGIGCSPDGNTVPHDLKIRADIIRTLVQRINEGRPDEAVRLLADDYEGHNVPLGTTVRGREDVREGLETLFRAFPDLTISIHRMLEESDSLVLYWSATGTHSGDFERIPATGRETCASGTSLFHFEDLVIIDGLHVWDFAGLLRSMRLLPTLSGRTGDRQQATMEQHFQTGNG